MSDFRFVKRNDYILDTKTGKILFLKNNPDWKFTCSRTYYETKKILNNSEYSQIPKWLDTIKDIGLLNKKEQEILSSQYGFKYDSDFATYMPADIEKLPEEY